jgi:hypothetical protein
MSANKSKRDWQAARSERSFGQGRPGLTRSRKPQIVERPQCNALFSPTILPCRRSMTKHRHYTPHVPEQNLRVVEKF